MKSIRWQLPFSYAAIALLAALVLGALMLWRLDGYYTQREVVAMRASAEAIQASLEPFDLSVLSSETLQAQVNSFAFMARSRVRIYAPDGAMLADSGEYEAENMGIRYASLPVSMAVRSQAGGAGDVIFIQSSGIAAPAASIQVVQGSVVGGAPAPGFEVYPAPDVSPARTIQAYPPPAGGEKILFVAAEGDTSVVPVFDTFVAADPTGWDEVTGGRTRHVIELPVKIGAGEGRLLLSGGPAYGRQIVASVARAWALAGLLAVALAAAAGWLASRSITRPVLALGAATERMTAGDLGARVGQLPGREFGALGKAFDEMAARVELTVTVLRRFAADAAHELKTPLTALRTDLELARTERDADQLAALLARAGEQVRELDKLTTGLLDLSRLETAAAPLETERLDLCAFARQVCEPFAARAEQAGQVFIFECPQTEIHVRGNPARLHLALANLLENALKFTPADGRVALRLSAADGAARLVVRDSGIGIPAEDLPLVFGRFHRGRNAAGYPGSGLGLAIVRAVAEAHDGAAFAANLPEGGAEVGFTLPAEE